MLTTVMDITSYQESIAAIPMLKTTATAPEAWNWLVLMQAIELKGGKVRPSERMTTATVELIRGVMGDTQTIFTNDNVLDWTLEQVAAALKKRYQIDTDFRVYAELQKIPPAKDEGRDATNHVITAVRGIVRLATMDLTKWDRGQNRTALKIILDKLGPKTRKALGPTGRFAVKSLAELVNKVSSLYDTQERVRRSEEECGLPTTTTRNAQGHVPKPESNETRDTQSRDKKERSTSPENSTAAIPEPRPSISSNALKAYSTSEEGILQERCLNCGDKRHTTNECERTTDNSEEMQQMREIFKEGFEKGVKCKERRAAVD